MTNENEIADLPHFDEPHHDKHIEVLEGSENTIKASSTYYVWCSTERKRIGSYTNDYTVAKNTKEHHLRYAALHSVSIFTK